MYEYELLLLLLYSSQKHTGWSARNRKFKRLEPHFQFFSDDVRLEGGHGNRCRFDTLTGVHQGAHTCLTKKSINGKMRGYEYNRIT